MGRTREPFAQAALSPSLLLQVLKEREPTKVYFFSNDNYNHFLNISYVPGPVWNILYMLMLFQSYVIFVKEVFSSLFSNEETKVQRFQSTWTRSHSSNRELKMGVEVYHPKILLTAPGRYQGPLPSPSLVPLLRHFYQNIQKHFGAFFCLCILCETMSCWKAGACPICYPKKQMAQWLGAQA